MVFGMGKLYSYPIEAMEKVPKGTTHTLVMGTQ
jgi:hypothetical protein